MSARGIPVDLGLGEDVAKVNDAGHVVLLGTGHREPRVRTLGEERQRLADSHGLGHRDEAAAGGHDLPHKSVLDVEHASQHVSLRGVDQATGCARAAQAGQLLR